MRSKLVGVVVVLAVVVAVGGSWRYAHRDDGKGPWVPATAVASCSGVLVEPQVKQDPTMVQQWSSGGTGRAVPEPWRGITHEIVGEFRRIPDSSDKIGRVRAEFRSGDVAVEVSTVSVECP